MGVMGDGSHTLRQQMLDQLAEQKKAGAIKDMQTKAAMLASLLAVALAQVWIGHAALQRAQCGQHWWLALDGAATCIGMLLGLTASMRGAQVASCIDAHHWLLADGKERDTSGDLAGVWRIVRQLSDLMDVVLVALFALGCYGYQASSGDAGDGCDDDGRAAIWLGRALVLKPLVPTSVTVALKVWHTLLSASAVAPAQQRKKR